MSISSVSSFEGEKIKISLFSNIIKELQSNYKIRIDDVKNRIDVELQRLNGATEADAKENSRLDTESIDEFKKWLKDLINKGNITRIRISKDEKEIVDVPVNAGIAAGVIAVIFPPVLAFIVIAGVVTQIKIEITKADGTVEVVNKYISKAVDDIKDAASDVAEKVKNKVEEVKKDKFSFDDFNASNDKSKEKDTNENNSFTYTVKFDEDEENRVK